MYLIKLSNNVFYTRISTPVALHLYQASLSRTHTYIFLLAIMLPGRLKRLKGHTLINTFDNAVLHLKTNLDVRFRNGLT